MTSMLHLPSSGVRRALPSVTSFRVAIGIALVSLFITLLAHAQDSDQRLTSFHKIPAPEKIAPQPLDLTSLMQGARVHVEFNSSQDKETPNNPIKQEPDAMTSTKDALVQHAKAELKGATHQAAATIGKVSAGFRARLWGSSFSHFAAMERVRAAGGIAVVLLVVLIGCTCVAGLGLLYDNRPSARASSNQAADSVKHAGLQPTTNPSPTWDLQSKCVIKPVGYAQLSEPVSKESTSSTKSVMENLSPPQNIQNEVPTAAGRMELHFPSPSSSDHLNFDAQRDPRPPPLCPTLVMPVCEARFGIPMYELAQLDSEGELGIVGLSGNPLLKAVVKKFDGHQRMLEISMPELYSAPRATITPSPLHTYGQAQKSSRAMEIRGMRGSFYGVLEMRSSGACYVVKDGQTVLTIDGEEHSLQLSIKSSIGAQLASVGCAAEPFGGVDHVEIRVEPGVDTVLVLSVVLAVLLLSPYLPNQAEDG
jgi:hypothetical protein